MAIKFEKIKPGMVLLNYVRVRMGNTVVTELAEYKVEVISLEGDGANVRWNGSRPKFWTRRRLERLYTKPPKAYRDQQEKRRRFAEAIWNRRSNEG